MWHAARSVSTHKCWNNDACRCPWHPATATQSHLCLIGECAVGGNSMRLLFVYPFCGLGGVESSVLNKLGALRLVGIEAQARFGTPYGAGGTFVANDSRVSFG